MSIKKVTKPFVKNLQYTVIACPYCGYDCGLVYDNYNKRLFYRKVCEHFNFVRKSSERNLTIEFRN